MVARQLFVFFVIAVFSLGLAGAGFSAGMVKEAKGTVTKIENGKVSIKDSMGEKTVEPTNAEVLTDLKVGDQVSVKDGKLIKEVGAGPSAPSPRPKY
jgi:pyruvate kinase